MIQIDTWENCYNLGWGDLLVPAAYSHPAKMARSLVFKIVQHALEEGWIQPGQWILDPFGGVGTTALPSLMAGLNYIGVELEPRFVELGCQNIALWNGRFSGMPKWTGQAQLLQGDSRRLAEVVSAAGLVVSSPPYAEIRMDGGKIAKEGQGGMTPYSGESVDAWRTTRDQANLGNLPPGTPPSALIASPPFAGNSGGRGEASRNGIDSALFDRHSGGMKGGTGSDPANLDHLKMGHIDAVISSPPYADGCTHTGGNDPHPEHIQGGKRGAYGVAVVGSPPYAESLKPETEEQTRRKQERIAKSKTLYDGRNLETSSPGKAALGGGYGETEGQLGGMKAGAVISSPPYEQTHVANITTKRIGDSDLPVWKQTEGDNYGKASGQMGQDSPGTFWAAAALIVQQCALLLPPGAAAIWILKDYVKAGKIVPFALQWQQLCEACGFETVHIHRAMLVKEHAAQKFMLGGIWITNKVSRKSFFRRLSEKRGAPPIDYETILCMRKAA